MTVVVTLILFCTREILDITKKVREKRRILSTFKALLSEELKDNFLALDRLYMVLEKAGKALTFSEDNVPVIKMIKTDRFGNDMVDIQIGKGGEYGVLHMPFPRFSTKRYDSYIKDVAVLDFNLYKCVTEVYKELRYCEKIRCELSEYLEQEENIEYWMFNYRISLMFDNREKYTKLMQDLHAQLTKKHMEIKWSEVIEINT